MRIDHDFQDRITYLGSLQGLESLHAGIKARRGCRADFLYYDVIRKAQRNQLHHILVRKRLLPGLCNGTAGQERTEKENACEQLPHHTPQTNEIFEKDAIRRGRSPERPEREHGYYASRGANVNFQTSKERYHCLGILF